MADEQAARRHDIGRPAFVGRVAGATTDPLLGLLDDLATEHGRTTRADRATQHEAERTMTGWLGLLAAAADRRTTVVLETDEGATHVGIVELAGCDVVVLRRGDEQILLAADHVRAMRTDPSGPIGDARSGSPVRPVTMRDLLADGAERRAPVLLRLRGGGDPVHGNLWSCGEDLCTVRPGDRPTTERVHVPIHAIREAVVSRG